MEEPEDPRVSERTFLVTEALDTSDASSHAITSKTRWALITLPVTCVVFGFVFFTSRGKHLGVEQRHMSTASELRVRRKHYLYLSQGPSMPPAWLRRVALREDAAAIFGYFKGMPNLAAIGAVKVVNASQTTWSSGRNLLYAEALALQKLQGWAYEYLVFTDEDAELDFYNASNATNVTVNGTSDVYTEFHRVLSEMHPAVGAVFPVGKNWDYPKIDNRCGPLIPCTTTIDGMFNAFHATVAPMVLPYSSVFDELTWHGAQIVMVTMLSSTDLFEYVRQFNQFKIPWQKQEHLPYPKGHENIAVRFNGDLSPVEAFVVTNSPACAQISMPWMISQLPETGWSNLRAACRECRKTTMLQDYSTLNCTPTPIYATFNSIQTRHWNFKISNDSLQTLLKSA